jgi:dephospho-CoA kinase
VGGGIGAGKGVVARLFEERGFSVISADEAGHRVLEPAGASYAEVAARWPSVVVGGTIDRSRLAAIVFADADALSELESITHPAIVETIAETIDALDGPVAVEVPLFLDLKGSWLRVFVDAEEARRIERAVDRGEDEADVRRRAAVQADRAAWLEWADRVIDNNGSLDELERQVDELVASLE